MSNDPRYEPIDDDLPPPDPDDLRPARPIKKPSPPAPLPTGEGSRPAKPAANPPISVAKTPEPKPEVSVKVVFSLPMVLVERIKAVRDQAGLVGEVPVAVPLTSTFSTTDEAALRESIAAFEKSHLPLMLTLKRVEAQVRERQSYSAAWSVDAETQFAKLHADLIDTLKLPPDSVIPFEPMIVVGSSVSAKQFPILIAAMQQHFVPLTWQIEKIEITLLPPA